MKKLLAVWMVCVLLFTSAFAAGTDYSEMTVSEILDVMNEARNELLERAARRDGNLFVVNDPDGLQIYITGNGETDWADVYQLEAVVINGTGENITVSFEKIIINGWETVPLGYQIESIDAGRRKKGSIPLILSETDLTSVSEVEEVEICFHTFDPASFLELKYYGPYTIHYDGFFWYGDLDEAIPDTRGSVYEPGSLDGTWQLTEAMSDTASEEEIADVKRAIDAGQFQITMEFEGNRVVAVWNKFGQEDIQTGTFAIEENRLTITRDGEETGGEPAEFRIDGDTFEMSIGGIIMIFSRQ